MVAGGQDASLSTTLPVVAYDPIADRWDDSTNLNVVGTFLQAAADSATGRALFVSEHMSTDNVDDAFLSDGTTWVSSRMGTPREGHAVAFAGGKFVVTGGWGAYANPTAGADSFPSIQMETASAEVLDPATGVWSEGGSMPGGARIWHRMTVLADGHRILVTGGCLPGGPLSTADILDVSTMNWSQTSPMPSARCRHGAVLLHDGRVLVTGSTLNGGLQIGADTELYDPNTNAWRSAAPMHQARREHVTLLLPDGRVLVAGGTDDAVDGEVGALASAEVYDPGADTWTVLALMHVARRSPTGAVLGDAAYVTGGTNADTVPSTKNPGATMSGSVHVLADTERLTFDSMAPPTPASPPAPAAMAPVLPPSPSTPDSTTPATPSSPSTPAAPATSAPSGGSNAGCSMQPDVPSGLRWTWLVLAGLMWWCARGRGKPH